MLALRDFRLHSQSPKSCVPVPLPLISMVDGPGSVASRCNSRLEILEQPADERAMAQWARESRWWAADGATRRQKAMRTEAVAKKHKGIALATRQKLFDAEHNALLALHVTKAAATANNATKVFKAHKRAGKQAWLAQKLLLKLYRLRNGILDRAIVYDRVVEEAVANAKEAWRSAEAVHRAVHERFWSASREALAHRV